MFKRKHHRGGICAQAIRSRVYNAQPSSSANTDLFAAHLFPLLEACNGQCDCALFLFFPERRRCNAGRSMTTCCRLFTHAMIPALQQYSRVVGAAAPAARVWVRQGSLGWLLPLDAAHHAQSNSVSPVLRASMRCISPEAIGCPLNRCAAPVTRYCSLSVRSGAAVASFQLV